MPRGLPRSGFLPQHLPEAGRAGRADVARADRHHRHAGLAGQRSRAVGARVGGHHDPHPQPWPACFGDGGRLTQGGQAPGQQFFFVVSGHDDTGGTDHPCPMRPPGPGHPVM